MSEATPVTVLIAHFEDIVARGLRALIDGERSVRLVGWDIERTRLGIALQAHRPDVTILNFGALDSPAEICTCAGDTPTPILCCLQTTRRAPSARRCWHLAPARALAR
jgi:hypothetical protein